jgi:hypothetical protein
MRFMPLSSAIVALGLTVAAVAQTPARPPAITPVPVEVALHDLTAAYTQTLAEAVTVKYRAVGSPERSDEFVIRMEAPSAPGTGPRRALLELGPIKASASAGSLTVISSSAPGKYYLKDYSGPFTPAALASALPPVPVPQLALADGPAFRDPTPYTPGVTWTDAAIDETARPPTVTLTGSCPKGKVVVVANAQSGRLQKLTANLLEGEAVLELTCRAIEPGDPAAWEIPVTGKEQVAALADLRTPATKLNSQVLVGQIVPDMTFSRPDLTPWSLQAALAAAAEGREPGAAGPPIALLLFRYTGTPERAAEAVRDAKTGLGAIRIVSHGRALPGEDPQKIDPIAMTSASAVIIELGEFSKERLEEARRGWGMIARARARNSAMDIPGDELMWGPAAGPSIDRLAPGATAVIAVIGPDRVLRSVIRLDGRYTDVAGIGAEVRSALKSAPQTKEPAEEAGPK